MVIIRYAHPEVGDQFICQSYSMPKAGIWIPGFHGRQLAIRFPDEATAKQFLVRGGYELPPLKVTFEELNDEPR